ncbi:sulfatase-like hydrolase/transferase [Paraglaciecola sp. L3A3]|uniref:sulfatase-like hydrolase/transferase n=1 Tax=Paraglaciecola sp. L3A3 TaxID=2686358 RepID=UPI00131E2BFC|nr:sulfatase-like hydrolase/transferase [Paraglaciecola sp. L3A3]
MTFSKLRLTSVITGLFLVLTTSATYAKQTEKAVEKPNIIFIFADDLGWGDISKHGHPDIRTPNIDRLAEEGSEFYQFSVSNPVCSPSRAAVLTGQYPSRNSVHRHFATLEHHQNFAMPDWLDNTVVTMPKVLRQTGYRTAHFGKWHLTNRNVKDAPLPSEYGYDEAAVFNGPGPQTDTFKLYDDALDFIKRNKDKPFFINLWIHETHTPHYPPKDSMAKYTHLNEQDQVYAAVVDGADQRIGKILNLLDELALTENTLVVFSSDNGPEVTGPKSKYFHPNDPDGKVEGIEPLGTYFSVGKTAGLRGQKRDTYEGGLRVPFLVRWPGHVPVGRVDTQSVVTAVDLLPTFADVAGAKLPEGYQSDGQSILPLLLGGTLEREKPMFWQWQYGKASGKKPMLAVREGPWKLFFYQDKNQIELYNLMTDRAESMNVADQYPRIVNKLKNLALEWDKTLPTAPPKSALSQQRKVN